jgi:hypothetical protein
MVPHPSHDRTLLGGCPGYVRGWCCKARDRTLQRGYRDVGYLLAAKLKTFRPERLSQRTWTQQRRRLRRLLKSNDEAAALGWFVEIYPQLMEVIPVGDHPQFVAGVRERHP